MNYTKEQTRYMIDEYIKEPTRETVQKLAIELNKSVKSVTGKLAREGVYRREIYKTKTGEDPVTKLEIVQTICEKLDAESNKLAGLEKAPKLVLKYLESLL